MGLYFEIMNGVDVGKKFPISLGARIGRVSGEILLQDKKISGLHATVEQTPAGQLILVDQGSSNGLIVSGKLVKSLILTPGVAVLLGRILLRVISSSEDLRVQRPAVSLAPQAPPEWRRALDFWTSKMSLQDSPTSNFSVQPFLPPVQLTFLLGPQADKEVVFGFGPRQIGSNCLDLEVIEDAAPGVSFELFSDKNAAHFKTEHPAVVWLNDEKISHRPLKDGDTIRIGGTLIRVNFVEFSSPKENP